MRRVLYLRVPHLQTTLERQWDPSLGDRPLLVIGRRPRGQGIVIDASPEAAAQGVTPGMLERPARRRCPEAICLYHEPARYEPVAVMIGEYLAEETPWVERCSLFAARVARRAPPAQDEFFADLGEGEAEEGLAIAQHLGRRLAAELGLEVRMTLATSPFVARALGRFNPSPVFSPHSCPSPNHDPDPVGDVGDRVDQGHRWTRPHPPSPPLPTGYPPEAGGGEGGTPPSHVRVPPPPLLGEVLCPRFGRRGSASQRGERGAGGEGWKGAEVNLAAPGTERQRLRLLEIDALWEAPLQVRRRMLLLGLRTLGQLAAVPQRWLLDAFGPAGRWYRLLARGVDPRRVRAWNPAPSLTAACSLPAATLDTALLEAALRRLAARVAAHLVRDGRYGRTVTVTLTLESGRRLLATRSLKEPTNLARTLARAGIALLIVAVRDAGRPYDPGMGHFVVGPDSPHPPTPSPNTGRGGVSACGSPGSPPRHPPSVGTRLGEGLGVRARTQWPCGNPNPRRRVSYVQPDISMPGTIGMPGTVEIEGAAGVGEAPVLALRVTDLEGHGALQLSIFGDVDRGPALRAVLARIQERFGETAIVVAALLPPSPLQHG